MLCLTATSLRICHVVNTLANKWESWIYYFHTRLKFVSRRHVKFKILSETCNTHKWMWFIFKFGSIKQTLNIKHFMLKISEINKTFYWLLVSLSTAAWWFYSIGFSQSQSFLIPFKTTNIKVRFLQRFFFQFQLSFLCYRMPIRKSGFDHVRPYFFSSEWTNIDQVW